MWTIKKALGLMKSDIAGTLTVAFMWCSLLFVTIILGRTVGYGIGFYIFLMIPATISLRFIYYTYSVGKPISYGAFKIGYVTIISSIKLYFRMIKEALLTALAIFVGGVVGVSAGIYCFNKETANTIIDMGKNHTLTFNTLFDAVPWLKIAFLILGIVIAVVYFVIKLQYNFLPYIAFQSPIDAKSAKDMGAMMARKKYSYYLLLNATALIFIIPICFGCNILYNYLIDNNILHSLAAFATATGAGCIVSVPVLAFYGLFNAVYYNKSSIPFQSQINHALDKLLNELKNLEENDFKDHEDKK